SISHFFFLDSTPIDFFTLSLHDALPIFKFSELLAPVTSFGVDVQNDERYNVKLFPPFSERRNIMKLLIALIVTLIMLTVFKNVRSEERRVGKECMCVWGRWY